jgi:hypothetical protein
MSQLFDSAPQDDTAGAATKTPEGSGEGNGAPAGDGQGGGSGDGQDPGKGDPPASGKETDRKAGEGEPDKGAGKAPEYADFSVPEGFTVVPEIMAEFKAVAGKMGFSQEQAQGLIDLHIKTQQGAVEAWTKQRADWRKEIETDPEYGRDKLRGTIRDARRVLDHYDPSGELLAELERSGHGDNPKIIRFLAQIARDHMKEDNVYTDRASAGGEEKPLRERLWPDEVMPK